MKHYFKHKSHDLSGLFEGVKKVSQFCRKLEQQAELDPDNYDRDKYVGDGFEFFTELLFQLMPYHRMMGGIHNYEPVQVADNGVDGTATNFDGKLSMVQVKYRSNKNTRLSGNEDHLGNMVKEGAIKYRVLPPKDPLKATPVFFVVTTAKSLHHYTDNEYFHNTVHCIGYDELRVMLDNNIGFWNACRNIVNEL